MLKPTGITHAYEIQGEGRQKYEFSFGKCPTTAHHALYVEAAFIFFDTLPTPGLR